MRQKLLVGLVSGLLFLSSVGIASADTIGHAVIDRSLFDNWANFSMIDYSLSIALS